jgi:hypothetical protein
MLTARNRLAPTNSPLPKPPQESRSGPPQPKMPGILAARQRTETDAPAQPTSCPVKSTVLAIPALLEAKDPTNSSDSVAPPISDATRPRQTQSSQTLRPCTAGTSLGKAGSVARQFTGSMLAQNPCDRLFCLIVLLHPPSPPPPPSTTCNRTLNA